jgi:hypothetical protein
MVVCKRCDVLWRWRQACQVKGYAPDKVNATGARIHPQSHALLLGAHERIDGMNWAIMERRMYFLYWLKRPVT